MKGREKPSFILYVSTFPPRECGIATFTKDLTQAMDRKFNPKLKSKILALNKDVNIYNYPEDAIYQVSDTDIQEYVDAARKINENGAIKIVNIQHEFGIFGGIYGDYIIAFLEILQKPVVVTFHTVLPQPEDKLKKVVQGIAEKASHIIVPTATAVDILRNDYGISSKITVVPHGIPACPFVSSRKEKERLGFGDKIVLTSFGMMGPGKGYEHVIQALPEVVKKHPNVVYLIIGQTHPVVRREQGESYRNELTERVKSFGLEKNVKFYNKYLRLQEIVQYLKATDIYISSSLNPNQIVSGTLAYAMGCGRAVVSTPFLHAQEAVTPDRGILVDFGKPKQFTDAITKLITHEQLRKEMERNAYAATRKMLWPNIALSYMNVFKEDIGARDEKKLPKLKLTHLMRMTDRFGVIQFSNHTAPDKASGYTLDDNSRALIVCCRRYKDRQSPVMLRLIRTYLNFISYVQAPDGKLYNHVDHDRKINMQHWSRDAHGRAVWALGYLISRPEISQDLKQQAEETFRKALAPANGLTEPRPAAFMILGLYLCNAVRPARQIRNAIQSYADLLVSLFKSNSQEDWEWFESNLTYSNSKLPEALLFAYDATKNQEYLRVGKRALDFLISITFEKGTFVPVGQNGWYFRNGQRAHFDQQPVDASSMVQTLVAAYAITQDKDYLDKASIAFQWFLGKNSLRQMVYDESTGGCQDGVGESSINLNQGAESTISYLLARLALEGKMRHA